MSMKRYYWYEGARTPFIMTKDGLHYYYYKNGQWLYDKDYDSTIRKITMLGQGNWWSLFDVTKEQAELYMKGLIDKPELN